jgi:tetratricopeptide (TPR) repeat protein
VTEGRTATTDRAQIQSFWKLYREATAQRVAGRTQLASGGYARALEINPDHEDALYYFGSMQLDLGEFDGAARAWRHLLSVNASSARTHSRFGTLFLCLDPGAPFQLDSAEQHLRRAHELNKEENGPVLRLGEVALLRGDLASARRHIATVLGTHAESVPAHFYAGYIAWKQGNTARARAEFQQAVSAPESHAPGGVLGEGDTKQGSAPLSASGERCNQLRAISEHPRAADPERDMPNSYRELDRLLAAARTKTR